VHLVLCGTLPCPCIDVKSRVAIFSTSTYLRTSGVILGFARLNYPDRRGTGPAGKRPILASLFFTVQNNRTPMGTSAKPVVKSNDRLAVIFAVVLYVPEEVTVSVQKVEVSH